MNCPGCGKPKSPNDILKCDKCGDTRCKDSGGCPGTMGGPKAGTGGQGALCKACRKGKYQRLS